MPLTEQDTPRPPVPPRKQRWWVRVGLLATASALIAVFFIATQVQPYKGDGTAMTEGSHQTIGMAPCRFRQVTEMPCPSCGMTTSFALLVRGDVLNSMRANWVGTGLAVGCALVVPWMLASAIRGRFLWVRRIEGPLGFLVGTFTVLMLVRWGVILLWSMFD